jgi:regulator of protease activity HflC (stomatin/prohibitin superfamily)
MFFKLNKKKITPEDQKKILKKKKRRRLRSKFIFVFLILLLITAYFWQSIFISIQSGERGILWHRFTGTDTDGPYGEGLHVIFPLDKMYVYTIRVQEIREEIPILTKNGLRLNVLLSARFRAIPEYLPYLHKYVGSNYVETVIRPEIITAVRMVLGNFILEEIYSKDEKGVLQDILIQIQKNLDVAFPKVDPKESFIATNGRYAPEGEKQAFSVTGTPYIQFVNAIIMRLDLPDDMQSSITSKLIEEQNFLKYKYTKEKALQEKQRKVLEAEGIKEFERIAKIPILKWEGIQATKEIAKSNNSKIIIMGTTSQDLPVILNTDTPLVDEKKGKTNN